MLSISSKTKLVLTIGIAGILIGFSVVPFVPNNTTDTTSEDTMEAPDNITPQWSVGSGQNIAFADRSLIGLPSRLKIPKIRLNTVIEHTGLTPKGAMDTPKKLENVAWFALGPRPWEVGSAVIDGHFGWKQGIPAVFNNLHKLVPGDRFSIQDTKGSSHVFVVRKLRTYKWNEEASEIFTSSDGKAHLNIITCHGSWNRSQKNYSDRLVVFADLVP